MNYNIPVDCTLPDHSVLVCKLELFENSKMADPSLSIPRNTICRPKMRCNDELLERHKQVIVNLADKCEVVGINKCYSEFCRLITPPVASGGTE